MKQFQVIIAGGRDFRDYNRLKEKCDIIFSRKKPTAILSGMANGADSLGIRYAEERGFPVKKFPTHWDFFGKRAGMVRNQAMLREADALIAFWDGVSSGTGNMISIATNAGIPIRVVPYKK